MTETSTIPKPPKRLKQDPISEVGKMTDAVVRAKTAKLSSILISQLPTVGQAVVDRGKTIKNPRARLRFLITKYTEIRNAGQEAKKYKDNKPPVGVREFICSKDYLNRKAYVWPKVLDQIEEACSGKYIEGVFTGGIGCAKTTAALYIQSYLLYLLSRLKSPHAEFGLDPASEIMIVFQSINATVAGTVDYARFREMIEMAPYFQKHFRHDYQLKKSMNFPNRIIVKSVSGADTAAIGQNVISGIIDEINFMAVVQKSKMSADGGEYNQAVELYNSIVRRRESRFMQQGRVWGLICLVSSARYPGQFTDRRKAAAKRDKRIFIYDKRAWDVMDENSPNYSYTGVWFRLFLGDVTRKPRIMKDHEVVTQADAHLVMDIPIEHLHAFEDDIYDAIRDIAGMATLAAHPFIPYPERIADAFRAELPSIFSREECDMVETKVKILPSNFINPERPRYAHCDLALTGDSCGVVIGHVYGFKHMERADGQFEQLPLIHIDGMLEIKPPRAGEIDLARVRGMLYKLRELGLPIKWVSYDSYNSADSIQIMKQQGFVSGLLSMDTTPIAYETMKQGIIDGRIKTPAHEKCQYELVTLERDPQTGKIDHTEVSSKDVADSMAGVCHGLTMRREIWASFGINPQQVPQSIQAKHQNSKRGVEGSVGG